jgi:sugar transport system substrate-binding protein
MILIGSLAAVALAVGACSGAATPAPASAAPASVAPASAAPASAAPASAAPASAAPASAAAKSLTVGVIFPDTQGFYAGVLKGVTDGAASAGQQVSVNQTNTQDDASKEAQFMQTLISAKVDAILTSAISGAASVPAIAQAVQAGIPVICYNTCINPTDMAKYVSAYAVGDPVEFGHKLGVAAAAYFKANKITAPKIGVLNCEFVEVCVNRRSGFEAALKEASISYTLVANQQATDAVKSVSVAKDMLIANPDINALMGESGGAAIGAVRGVQAAGLTGKVVVFGSDMTTDLANALADNTILKGDVDVSGQQIGQIAIKTAIDVLNGVKPANLIVPVPINIYTTPDQAKAWLQAHPDGIP